MKKHAVYLTVDELTDIIIAYDGSITLLKQNRRELKEQQFIKEEYPHIPDMYTETIEKEQKMMDKLIQIRNELKNKEESNMTNEEKRWNALPNFDNETVKIWLDDLLESTNKMYIEELTVGEIKAEIEESKGSIGNFELLGDRHAIIDCEEYIEALEEMLNDKEALV